MERHASCQKCPASLIDYKNADEFDADIVLMRLPRPQLMADRGRD